MESGKPKSPRLHIFFSLGTNPSAAEYSIDAASDARFSRVLSQLAQQHFETGKVGQVSGEGSPVELGDQAAQGSDLPHGEAVHSALAGILRRRPDLVRHLPTTYSIFPTRELYKEIPLKDPPVANGKMAMPPVHQLRADLSDLHDLPGIEVEDPLRVLDAKLSPAESWDRIVDFVLESVGDDDYVLLETTNGLRPFQTGFVLATILLRALKPNVKLMGMTYAELRGAQGTVYDLAPYFELALQSPAIAALRYRFDALPLVRYIEELDARGEPVGELKKWVDEVLKPLAEAIDMAQPRRLRGLLVKLRDSVAEGSDLRGISPPYVHLVKLVDRLMSDMASELGEDRASASTDCQDERGIAFELELVERLVRAERHGDAARLLRETIVSAVVLAEQRGGFPGGESVNTADRKMRKVAETRLHRSSGAWKAQWTALQRARNDHAHPVGAGEQAATAIRQVMEEGLRSWVRELRGCLRRGELGELPTLVRGGVTTRATIWFRDLSLLGPSPRSPIELAGGADFYDVDSTTKPRGKNWGQSKVEQCLKRGVPERAYLTVSQPDAWELVQHLQDYRIRVFSWDPTTGGSQPFRDPHSD